jgi:hypothetical protein
MVLLAFKKKKDLQQEKLLLLLLLLLCRSRLYNVAGTSGVLSPTKGLFDKPTEEKKKVSSR